MIIERKTIEDIVSNMKFVEEETAVTTKKSNGVPIVEKEYLDLVLATTENQIFLGLSFSVLGNLFCVLKDYNLTVIDEDTEDILLVKDKLLVERINGFLRWRADSLLKGV